MRTALRPRYRLGHIVAVVLVATTMFFGVTAPVYADVNNFTIEHFNADETLSRTDKQGSLHITETIKVLFTDNNHGLLRSIPRTYKKQPLQLHNIHVSSPSGAPTDVSESSVNGNTVLHIGGPNRTVTGSQTYVISYDINNVITFYPDHDELYWDVNGDQWPQPVILVDYTLHLPPGLRLSGEQPRCYAGSYGATGTACSIRANNQTIQASAARLDGYQTLTVIAGFQKGYFTPPTLLEKIQPHILTIVSILLLPLITLIVGWRIWWKRGRDPKGKKTIVPEYAPPKDLTATEAGALMDFKVDNRDVTAAIIDLALRKYIRIIETHINHTLARDETTYTLELLNNDMSALNYYEKVLVGALFPAKTIGAKLNISETERSLYGTAKFMRNSIQTSLKLRGYFRSTSGTYLKTANIVGVVVLVSYYLLEPLGLLGVGILLSTLIAWLFVRAMPSRTQLGVDAMERLEGLKLYIETAEKDRIAKLQSPNAPYAPASAEPVRTVELFEKLLPYAMVLGVEKQWAKQFEDIYLEQPDWYTGNPNRFSSGVLVGSLSSGFQNNLNSAFTPPRSSGGSGFGGGFSGGGGGGGGGGGW